MSKIDEPCKIAMDCYHAGSMARAGKTIGFATVDEWGLINGDNSEC